MNINIKTKYNELTCYLLLIIIIFLYLHAFFHSNINADAGYYLGTAKYLQENPARYLFKDITSGYPPVYIYLFNISTNFKLFNEHYLNHLIIIYIATLVTSVLIHSIIYHYIKNKTISVYSSLIFLLLNYTYEGIYIILEPFVNLFGLLSIYILLKLIKRQNILAIIISSILVSLAILSKQYGAGYIFLCALIILNNSKTSFLSIFIYLITLAFTLILILKIAGNDQSIAYIFKQLTGEGYGDKSVKQLLISFLKLILKNGLFLFAFPIIIFKNDNKEWKEIILHALGVFGFSLIYYYRSFPHYNLLIVPHLIIIGALIYNKLKNLNKFTNTTLIIYSINILTILVLTLLGFNRNSNHWDRKNQYQIANRIKKAIPENTKTFLLDEEYLYYLNNYKPVLPKKYGYSFFSAIKESDQNELVNNSQAIIGTNKELAKIKIDLKNFEIIDSAKNLIILKRKFFNLK